MHLFEVGHKIFEVRSKYHTPAIYKLCRDTVQLNLVSPPWSGFTLEQVQFQ